MASKTAVWDGTGFQFSEYGKIVITNLENPKWDDASLNTSTTLTLNLASFVPESLSISHTVALLNCSHRRE